MRSQPPPADWTRLSRAWRRVPLLGIGPSTAKNNDEVEVVKASAAGDVRTQIIMAASDKLKELGVKFKVVNVADLLSLQSAKENDEALTDEEFADIFTADKPVLFAYHSYAHDVRGLIYDRPNHDNFNVHGYEEEGSTLPLPYDMVRVNRIDRYDLTAEALRMIDADKYADKIDELEKFRDEAFQFAVDNGYVARLRRLGIRRTPTRRVPSPLPPLPLATTSDNTSTVLLVR